MDELRQRVLEMLPDLRDRAAGAEEARCLPDDTVKVLKDAGLLRLLQPARWGGGEGDPRDFFEAVMDIGAVCGSTAWVAGVVGVHPWQVALFDDRVQREVWGDDPDTWVSSSYMPGGRMDPVDGGYRLRGRWSFSSGCDHCGWAILGVLLDRGGGAPPEMWNVLVPRSGYRIEDVWHTVGLRGTGSNDIVVDDLFVPAYRALDLKAMFEWRSPGLAVNDGPLYRLPFATMFASAITAAIIGMARGVLVENMEHTKQRVSRTWGRASEDPYTIAALGRAASEIDGCRLQLLGNVGAMYQTTTTGGSITMDQRSRARRDQVLGSQRAVAAMDDVFDRAGAGAISTDNPMQRLWRDAHAARHHTVNSLERSLASAAAVAMGGEPTDLML